MTGSELPAVPIASDDPVSRLRGSRRSWLALAILLAILGSGAASYAGQSVVHADQQRSDRTFAVLAGEVTSTLQLAIQHEEDLQISTRGFITGNPGATQAQFVRWSESIEALQRFPELSGLGFVVVVPDAQLAAFGKQALLDPVAQAPANHSFQVLPPGRRAFYCLSKLGRFRGVESFVPIGFDACGSSAARSVAFAARDSGLGSYSPVTVGHEVMLALQIPLYEGGTTPLTLQARRKSFIGWIGMGVHPNVVLARAVQGHPGITAAMHYQVGTSDVTFSSGEQPAHARSRSQDLKNGWTVTTFGAATHSSLLSNGYALALLLTGVGLSLLLAVLIYVLGTGRSRALRLVQRKTSEIQHMALHDALTGLPNRALILHRITQALARARRENSPIGLMFLDLDGFKAINDTFGHAAGDELLREVAVRLTAVIRDGDSVGRLGGDEFVVLVEGSSTDDAPESVAARIRLALAEPFPLTGGRKPTVRCHASIGIAGGVRPSADELLHDADIALYEAKHAGKNRAVTFTAEMTAAPR